MPTISGRGRTEEITDYEAECLLAGFLATEEAPGVLTVPSGEPVGRGLPVSHWDLIDRTLTTLRGKSPCSCDGMGMGICSCGSKEEEA